MTWITKNTTDIDTGEPIAELGVFAVEPAPELVGKVARSINRRNLVSDSLDFSFMVMLKTLWEFFRVVMETIPGIDEEEDRNGR